jgi:hypothetical protein
MYLIAIAWMYVVLMMAVTEALSAQGTVLGAVITFLFYGILPLGLLMYILGTPGRKRLRKAAEGAEVAIATAASSPAEAQPSAPPDGGGQTPGAAIAPVRKEP